MKEIMKTIAAGIAGLFSLCAAVYLFILFCLKLGEFLLAFLLKRILFLQKLVPIQNEIYSLVFGFGVVILTIILCYLIWNLGDFIRFQLEGDKE